MAKFFNTPFGASASKTTIPTNDGVNVSWNTGYTVNYEYNPLTDKSAKHVERDVLNTLFYEITSSLRQVQLTGVAPYYDEITKADGPGYSAGALISYGGFIWQSKVDANRSLPNANQTDKWGLVYEYGDLVARLLKDGHLGSGGGSGGGGDSYSKFEIDQKLSDLNESVIADVNDGFKSKDMGDISLTGSWDADQNATGYFLCNGDYLPFDRNGAAGDGNVNLPGNRLYELCYTSPDDNDALVVETDFKQRWNIDVDFETGKIQLPNILGYLGKGKYTSDTNYILPIAGKLPGVTKFDKKLSFQDIDETDKGTEEEEGTGSSGSGATEEKTDGFVYLFTMVPTIYLGSTEGGDNDGDDTDDGSDDGDDGE